MPDFLQAAVPLNRRKSLIALAAAVGASSLSSRLWANSLGPVRLVVPFTPGTGIDLIARVIGPKLSERFNRPFVVDNKPGASGNIGTQEVVRASADGTTLLVTVNTLIMNNALYPQMGFNPVTDLTPISQTSVGQLVLLTTAQSSATDLSTLIAQAKQTPWKLNYGSPGAGTPHHLAMELLRSRAKIDLTHISYRGTSQALTDLLGGQIDLMFLPIHVALPHIKSGKLRALAISSAESSPLLPTVPSLNALNLGDMNVDMWYGLLGPRGMAPELVTSLNEALRSILQEPDVAKAFESQGMTPQHSTHAAFRKMIEGDAQRWSQLIKSQGIKAE